jgi:serine/threonine-protein kinase RsbW
MTETLHLRIPAKPEYLVLGRLALSGLSRLRPIDQDDLSDLKLALTEACTNSIRHAYGDSGGSVEIEFVLEPESITIEVLDDGAGFRMPNGSGPGDGLDEGGLGLAIISAVTDEAESGRRDDGTGSRLRFRKRLAERQTDDAG